MFMDSTPKKETLQKTEANSSRKENTRSRSGFGTEMIRSNLVYIAQSQFNNKMLKL